jgi:hypothetical protein
MLYRKILLKSMRQKSYFPMSYYFELLHFYSKYATLLCMIVTLRMESNGTHLTMC